MRIGTVSARPGEKGDWLIDAFEIDREGARWHNLRCAMNGNPDGYVREGHYKRLVHKQRGTIMSNTDMEVATNREAYANATGRVLINGLGLGMILEAILSKPDVTYVRVIEAEQDVIDLVGPTFANDPRVEIIHADAMEYLPAKGERFDYVWHDIWDAICTDNLDQMTTLSRRYSRFTKKQGFWARDICRRERRRYR